MAITLTLATHTLGIMVTVAILGTLATLALGIMVTVAILGTLATQTLGRGELHCVVSHKSI